MGASGLAEHTPVAHTGEATNPLVSASFRDLAKLLAALKAASPHVDYDDEAAEAAYYAAAAPVIEAIIALPARNQAELRIKAEAYAWCVGGLPDMDAPDATTGERLASSLIRDLLRS